MASTTLHPGPAVHGGTALGVRPEGARHRLGDAVRAVRVFAVTAVEVALLGNEPAVGHDPLSRPDGDPDPRGT